MVIVHLASIIEYESSQIPLPKLYIRWYPPPKRPGAAIASRHFDFKGLGAVDVIKKRQGRSCQKRKAYSILLFKIVNLEHLVSHKML